MITLLVESGTKLQWDSGAVRISKQNKLIKRIPAQQLETVWIVGNVALDSRVLMRLAEHRVAISLLPARGKGQITNVGTPAIGAAKLRLAQRDIWCNANKKLHLAKQMLLAKCSGYQLALKHSIFLDSQDETTRFCHCLSNTIVNINKATKQSSLLGIEGNIARMWFALLTHVIDLRFSFRGRNRRPSKDPLNALLSLSYSLVLTDIENQLSARGFDLAFGFLHELLPGRHSLALDVLESFRPIIDSFCLTLAQQHLNPDDFYYEANGACKLKKQTMSLYFSQFHAFRLDPVFDMHLKEPWVLWPHASHSLDGESLVWFITQISHAIAATLYQIANDTQQKGAAIDNT